MHEKMVEILFCMLHLQWFCWANPALHGLFMSCRIYCKHKHLTGKLFTSGLRQQQAGEDWFQAKMSPNCDQEHVARSWNIYIQSTTLVHWNILTPVRWIATKFTTDTHGPPDFSSSAIIWSNLLFCQILWFLTKYLKYSWNPHQLYFVFTAKYSWHAKPTC